MKSMPGIKAAISMTHTVKLIVIIICLALTGILLFGGESNADLTIKANHDHIKVDFFYHGSTVSVRGESDAGTDLIVKITSPDGHQKLQKKGKASGFLWMNVGDLNLEHTPNLYFLHSTGKLDEILDPEELNQYVLGYSAVKKHADISPVADEAEKTRWFDEFIKFKESSKLYDSSSGQITVSEENGRQKYYILCEWPYQALPGDYLVTVYAVKDKKVIEKAEANVLVEQVGTVKSLYDLANNRGGLYGLISVFAALSAGFGVGMVFRKGGGAH